MNDLVGIAAEQKLAGLPECFEDKRELDRCYILDFVDHHKIISRRGFGQPVLRDEVQIEEFRLIQPGQIFLEEVIEPVSLSRRENGLAHAHLAQNARNLYYANGFERAGQEATFLS